MHKSHIDLVTERGTTWPRRPIKRKRMVNKTEQALSRAEGTTKRSEKTRTPMKPPTPMQVTRRMRCRHCATPPQLLLQGP